MIDDKSTSKIILCATAVDTRTVHTKNSHRSLMRNKEER